MELINKNLDRDFALKVLPVVNLLRAYHRHEVIGIERIPKNSSVIIACSHSLATYDIPMLMAAVYEATNRFPRSLVDHMFYKFPFLAEVMEKTGCVEGSHMNALKLLNDQQVLFVAPGGMKESLRPSSKKYRVLWHERKGFVRLALETQTPIVLAACPKADDIYTVYENGLTNWIYKRFKAPFFLANGIGVSPLPKPVKLYHYLSKPIVPPEIKSEKSFNRQVTLLHKKVVNQMNQLMETAL